MAIHRALEIAKKSLEASSFSAVAGFSGIGMVLAPRVGWLGTKMTYGG